ncbi:MAG: hypothetical protein ACRD8W_03760 [Nitrososphaeraceae archaeon]
MADLVNLFRVLYFLYEAYHFGKTISLTEVELKLSSMHAVGYLLPTLTYLVRTYYVVESNHALYLTGDGIRVTEVLYRKFLAYLSKERTDELSTWINSFELHRNSSWELIRDIYFYVEIQQQPLRDVFFRYLDELGSLENVIGFEIQEVDLGSLIDDIFMSIYDVNMLFEHRFRHKLFCQSAAAQPHLNRAARNPINLTALIATIASIIDGICNKEIDTLLGPNNKVNGSVNKIQTLLDTNGISYDINALKTLRTLHNLRSTTFPIHNAGSQEVSHLKELQIDFPIGDDRDAAVKMLRSLNSSLAEMKNWFA